MIPAFSPGPCTTRLLRVGSRFRCTREDLYEQCSLHITLKMPSSVMVGSRPPSSCLTFSYSSGVSPCSRTSSGVMAGVAAVVMGKFYCRIFRDSPHVQSSHTQPLNFFILSEIALALAREQCSEG